MRIRDATAADVPAILDLYNALIPSTTIAWTEELETLEQMEAWFAAKTDRGHPVLVAVDDAADGEVVGYCTYGDFRDVRKWPGYRFTVEHTVHVRGDRHGTGVGRALVEALLDRARAAGVRTVVAAVDGANEGSVRFHERLGFEVTARMPELGFKHGRWLDLVLLQRQV